MQVFHPSDFLMIPIFPDRNLPEDNCQVGEFPTDLSTNVDNFPSNPGQIKDVPKLNNILDK